MHGLGCGWRLVRLLCVCISISALLVTVTMALGSFSTSDLYSAMGLPPNQPPRYIYLIDPDRHLKMRVYPPFDPETIWTIQPRWDQPGQAYVWQRLRGDTFGDDATVLYLQDIRTGQIERLLDTRENTLDVAVTVQESLFVSPNGRYFAFGRWMTGDIYVLDRELGEVHQVLNLSANSSPVQGGALGYSSPRWSPDSQRIAYTRNDMLFILSPDGDEPSEIKMPGNAVHNGQWADDSQTVLIASFASTVLFPSRYDVAANQLETIGDIDPTALMSSWHCDGRWLTYLVSREINPYTNLPSGNPPLYAGFIRNMENGEVIELDTILAAEAQNVISIQSLNCGEPSLMLIYSQVSEEVAAARAIPRPTFESRILTLLDLTTKEAVPLTSAGWFQRWHEKTQTLIYATDEGNNVRKVYKRQMGVDAKSVEIGTYTYDPQHSITAFSNDYRYMLVIEGIPQINSDGRLKKIDLQTGQQVYLTGMDERVRSVTSIP